MDFPENAVHARSKKCHEPPARWKELLQTTTGDFGLAAEALVRHYVAQK
jgi:hypothetical protein